MSSRNILQAADRLPHLLHFLDLFGGGVTPERGERSFPLGDFPQPAGPAALKSVYEAALPFLENRAAELDYREDLLELQRGLYRELEYLNSLAGTDPRHHFFVVVPVADRPSMLRNCVMSLAGQCEDFGYGGIAFDSDGRRFFRKVTLFIVDDSAGEDNREEIRQVAADAVRMGLRTFYFGPDEQGDLLRRRGGLAGDSSRLTGSPGSVPASHKGASVTRNIAYLYLNSFIREAGETEKALIYFLDSDEEFGVRVRKNGAVADARFINYFYWLDRIFSAGGIEVLTGKVVGDPPVSPSVMINTFLDDVLLFLETASRLRPEEACPFHAEGRPEAFSAGYHDMVELFGYRRSGASEYNCTLPGDHTVRDCFREFSRHVPDFFHGLHPTRAQLYRHPGGFTETEGARTVYTGNYVLTPAALKYFIPFADLKLRMAGPTLGRILKSLIGDRFVSANLPLLHRRTNPDSSRVYRSGISGTEDSVDLSGEFVRQFWGDVMLFSVESLAASGFPRRRPDLPEISSVVRAVQRDMWKLYGKQKAGAVAKAGLVKERLLVPDNWWNGEDYMKEAVRNIELLCSVIVDNFGEGSRGMKSLSSQVDEGAFTDILIGAISSFPEDELAWKKLLEADIPV